MRHLRYLPFALIAGMPGFVIFVPVILICAIAGVAVQSGWFDTI